MCFFSSKCIKYFSLKIIKNPHEFLEHEFRHLYCTNVPRRRRKKESFLLFFDRKIKKLTKNIYSPWAIVLHTNTKRSKPTRVVFIVFLKPVCKLEIQSRIKFVWYLSYPNMPYIYQKKCLRFSCPKGNWLRLHYHLIVVLGQTHCIFTIFAIIDDRWWK